MAFGQEQNTGTINHPGTYKDPKSGAILTVNMAAGADALVRLGWELQPESPKTPVAVVPSVVSTNLQG